MSGWHEKDIGSGIEAAAQTRKLFAAFHEIMQGDTIPQGMSVFSKRDAATDNYTWWFAPEAASLAATFAATPCKKLKPSTGLTIAVSTGDGWQFHFPGFTPTR